MWSSRARGRRRHAPREPMIANEARTPAWAYPALWTLVGLAFAGQHYLTSAKVGAPVAWGTAIAGALVDWHLFGLLALPAARLARRFNLAGPQWRLRLVLHVLASAVFSLAWILLRSALAQLIVPLRGVEKPFGDVLRYVLVATFFFNILVYWVVVTGTHALAYQRHLRDRERRLLELESRLQSARLHALRMQLNPHFLFNALNGIGSLMYRDVDAADSMLVRLASMLRHSLDRSDEPVVPLRDELAFLDRYLDLEQMRFPGRLVVQRDIDPALLDQPVPNLILQPLVENAIKHGVEPLARPVTVIIRAMTPSSGRLRMEVLDDGPGLAIAVAGEGRRERIGTSNTRRRIQQLHGTAGTFTLSNRDEGGACAAVEWPIRTAR